MKSAFAASFLLLLFSCATALRAEEVTSILAADGKTIVPEKVTKFVEWVEPYVHEYPPEFKDEAQKKQITDALRKVADEIQKMDVTTMSDVEMLTTLGYILAMGHNADLRTALKTHMFFQRAITLDHDHRRANYLYGMFLMNTQKYHFDSLLYLQKALNLGERDAQYYIALLYYEKGDRGKAVDEMSDYTKATPNARIAEKVLKEMIEGTLELTPAPKTPPPDTK
jgi:hypothetical protein